MTSNMVAKQRLSYVDLSKAIAIWLVVWGHSLSCLAGNDAMSGGAFQWIGNWIYSFHMPLFMILSGFFASSALQRPVHVMVWQKFRQLVWPCVTFGCILAMLYRYWSIHLDTLQHGVLFFGLFYDYWFLHCLFANFCIAWIVYRMPRRLRLLVFGIILIAIFYMFSRGHNLFNMSTMTFPFFIGIEGRRFLPQLTRYSWQIFIASSIFFAMIFPFYDNALNSSTYFFTPFSYGRLLEWLYREAIGIVGTLSIVSLCVMIMEKCGERNYVKQVLKIGGVRCKCMYYKVLFLNVCLLTLLT